MEPVFSPFFQPNNNNAYTGDNSEKHPELLIFDLNDHRICNFKIPLNTEVSCGRTWAGNQTKNFVALAGIDDTFVSSQVATVFNADNKQVTITCHKMTLATGWPVWTRGEEMYKFNATTKSQERVITFSRGDNEPLTHKATREMQFTFQVKWPKNQMQRQMTQAYSEPPETLPNREPSMTLQNDQTQQYAGLGGRAGGGADEIRPPSPKEAYPLMRKLQEKVLAANKTNVTEIKVWVLDDRFKEAFKCDKVDKNGKPINGFVLQKFLQSKYDIWKRDNREVDALYTQICEAHNKVPLVIIAQIKKEEAAEAQRKRNADNAQIRKEEDNRLRQVDKVKKRHDAKADKKRKSKADDVSSSSDEDDSQDKAAGGKRSK